MSVSMYVYVRFHRGLGTLAWCIKEMLGHTHKDATLINVESVFTYLSHCLTGHQIQSDPNFANPVLELSLRSTWSQRR